MKHFKCVHYKGVLIWVDTVVDPGVRFAIGGVASEAIQYATDTSYILLSATATDDRGQVAWLTNIFS